MTFDLAKGGPRVSRQARSVSRRPGILPEVDNRQRGLQSFAEMRNARRGGGSAEALMDALGVVNRAVQDLGHVAVKADEKKQAELSAKGALDEAAGTVDEKQARKSRSYRDAVSFGRANSQWAEHKSRTDIEFTAFIEGQEGDDLATRQAEAARWIEDRYFKGFALAPETGQVRNFGSPGAARAIAEKVAATRGQLMASANARIEQRLNGEALRHFSNAVSDGNREGRLDLAQAVKMLPPGLPREVIAETFAETTKTVAGELMREAEEAETPEQARPLVDRAIRALDEAMGYAEKGTGGLAIPSELGNKLWLTSGQRLGLLRTRSELLERGKRVETEIRHRRASAAEDGFALRLVGQGPILTKQEVLDRADDGTLTGKQAAQWVNSIDAQAEAQEDRAAALEARSERGTNRAREEQAESILGGYGSQVLTGKLSPAQARRRLLLDLPQIRDPLVRASVLSAVSSFFNGVENVRLDTPEARSFVTTMERVEQDLGGMLGGRSLVFNGRRLTPDQAFGLVKGKVDQVRTRGISSLRDTGKGLDERAIRYELRSWLNLTFPQRPR